MGHFIKTQCTITVCVRAIYIEKINVQRQNVADKTDNVKIKGITAWPVQIKPAQQDTDRTSRNKALRFI